MVVATTVRSVSRLNLMSTAEPVYQDLSITLSLPMWHFPTNHPASVREFFYNQSSAVNDCCDASFPVEVGLERDTYNAAETDGTTEQICAVLLVDPADFINGTDGVFNAIRRDFGLMTDPVISIQITSSVLGTSDAAQGIEFLFIYQLLF